MFDHVCTCAPAKTLIRISTCDSPEPLQITHGGVSLQRSCMFSNKLLSFMLNLGCKTRCGVSRTLASDPQPHRLRILCSSPSPHFYPHPDVLVLLLSSTGPHLRPLWLIYRVQTINFVNASSPERFFHIQYLHWHGLTVLEFVSKLHCHTAQTSWKRPRLSKRLAKEGALPHDCNAMRRAGHNSKHHTCGLVNAELVTDIGWGFGIFAYHLNNLCTSIPNFILPLPN